ncbi:hypothetical protein NDU88_006401 [Pleurodeles waltl]|uniref:Uncharacterized protein n=1 Tax=Pleurodeles waltl TaxID=8319 RepID=A0AAV7NQ40_PLEWA|nr:hypothetical protein NDU88_006401 [Pleurodeles waltl]
MEEGSAGVGPAALWARLALAGGHVLLEARQGGGCREPTGVGCGGGAVWGGRSAVLSGRDPRTSVAPTALWRAAAGPRGLKWRGAGRIGGRDWAGIEGGWRGPSGQW